jgi:hypothetical protein
MTELTRSKISWRSRVGRFAKSPGRAMRAGIARPRILSGWPSSRSCARSGQLFLEISCREPIAVLDPFKNREALHRAPRSCPQHPGLDRLAIGLVARAGKGGSTPFAFRDFGKLDDRFLFGPRPMAETRFQIENGAIAPYPIAVECGRKPPVAVIEGKCATTLVFAPTRW